jgi:hypothetical protein
MKNVVKVSEMSELLSMSPSQLGALLVLVALFMQDTLQAQHQPVRSKPTRAATAFACSVACVIA